MIPSNISKENEGSHIIINEIETPSSINLDDEEILIFKEGVIEKIDNIIKFVVMITNKRIRLINDDFS